MNFYRYFINSLSKLLILKVRPFLFSHETIFWALSCLILNFSIIVKLPCFPISFSFLFIAIMKMCFFIIWTELKTLKLWISRSKRDLLFLLILKLSFSTYPQKSFSLSIYLSIYISLSIHLSMCLSFFYI